jgi:hypothetical protein
MPATASQNAWIERVLGYRFANAPQRRLSRKPPSAYVSIRGREIWRAAREKVGTEITALEQHLRAMPDPEMQRIATFGLNGATGKLSVGLLAALSEADGVPPEQQPTARKKARAIVADYQTFLRESRLVRLLDENPFGVPVTIRATLGNALTEIDQALSS